MYQDSDGYLWVGTRFGVARFDGISFKNYGPDDGFPLGDIIRILQWNEKMVFLSNRSLIFLYPDGKIEVKNLPANILFATPDVMTDITVIDDDKIILANARDKNDFANSLVYQYSLKGNSIKKYIGEPLTGYVCSIKADTLLTYSSMYLLDHQKLLFQKIADLPVSGHVAADKNWNKFFIRKDSSVHVYNRNGLNWTLENSFSISGKAAFLLRAFVKDDGTYIYADGKTLKTYPESGAGFGHEYPYIKQIFVDKENNLWICSETGLFNYFTLNMIEYRFGIAKDDAVWSVLEDSQKNIWLGSFGNGLWKMGADGGLKPVNNTGLGGEALKYQYMGSSKSKDGSLFFPNSHGVLAFSNGFFKILHSNGVSLITFFDDDTQTLYAGVSFEDTKKALMVYKNGEVRYFPWEYGHIISIVKDFQGRIRVGSFYNQGIFNGDTILPLAGKRKYNSVICMDTDSAGRVWKGTENGVFVEMKDGSEMELGNGKNLRMIGSIYVYKNKYLLLGGLKSINIVDIENIENYQEPAMWEIGYEYGYTGLESGQNGFMEDSSCDVWLTGNVLVKFNPEKLISSLQLKIPSIRVASIFYSWNNVDWKQHIFSPNAKSNLIKIPAQNKFLRFEFVSNSIASPKTLRFKYRLKGFSDEWSAPTYAKSAEFTNIKSGKYQFEVQCSIDGLRWSAPASSPQIKIITPFMLRWFMWIGYLFTMLLIVAWASNAYAKYMQRKKFNMLRNQKLENELQLRNLQSKMLPHFTNNVLTAIANIAMDDNRKAGRYISLFSKFNQMTLQNADKNYNSLKYELEYIESYLELEKMRFGNKLEYKIICDEDVDLSVLVPSMALHTYCDNAIRHGLVNKSGNGMLIVYIQKKPDGINISVEDNGIGRTRSIELGTQGNMLGLALISQQIEFYNKTNKNHITQTVSDLTHDEKPAGTKIDLFIPDGFVFGKS